MFYCASCNKLSTSREISETIVVEKREKNYYKKDEKTGEDKLISTGWEIVREARVCKECYRSDPK